ncbi:hypothetical protein ACI76O_11870, partial [Capnocytophaga cynodegmi]|uniref:hypothetical protein n=1 Tax=Capnocytophaga cynodegmi TaxID=28189 RepID=UPI00385F7DC8
HGIFKLEHPFKKDETKKGTFRTLMDYASETTFAYSDWKQINDPALKIGFFGGQSEGALQQDEDILLRIAQAMQGLGGKAFLKCKECDGISVKTEQNLEGEIITIDINSKKYYKCILGEHKNGAISFGIKGLNKNLSTQYDKTTLTEYYEKFSSVIKANTQEGFLLVGDAQSVTKCDVTLQFSGSFCGYEKNSRINKEDKAYIAGELENCFEDSVISELQKVLSNPFYKDVKLAVVVKHENTTHTLFSAGFQANENQDNAELTLHIDTSKKEHLGVERIAVSPKYLEKYVEKLQQEANRRGIEVDVQTLRREVIKDLEGKETTSWFAKLAQKAKALYHDQIGTFAEAVLASQKIAKNVWEEGQINQSTWYSKNQEHEQWPEYAQFAPVVGGATDGVIDEIVGIPMAIKGIYGIMTDEEQRQAIANVFTKEGMNQLWEGLKAESQEILSDNERLTHFGSKTVVQVAAMLVPGTQLTKGKKIMEALDKATDVTKILPQNVTTYLKKLSDTNRYNPEILKSIEDLFAKIDPKILDKLVEVPGFDKVITDMAQHWKKFRGGKFQLEYFSKKIENLQGKLRFEAPQTLVIDGKEVARIYDATIENAGEITKYELKNWAGWYPSSIKNQFIKDIQSIEKLDELKWVFNTTSGVNKTNLKEKIISTLKKADGTPIEELNRLFDEESIVKKLKKTFGDEIETPNDLIKKLDDEKIFNQIFEVAE